jgi:KDO2-lipid IV(A) lauroyltransferase
MFIKDFRSGKLNSEIKIEGQEILNEMKKFNKQVVFISGHFGNFELMAMHLEKTGINLAAIYRPLNNIFLNKIMERIRKKYICKNQIKKGIGGLKELVKLNKSGYSTALMIDQRVSEGSKINFFNEKAFTTTIPAQLVKRFNVSVVPIFIERFDNIKFKMTVNNPIDFAEGDSIDDITENLNGIIEKMIIKNPNNWIWSHNRWK